MSLIRIHIALLMILLVALGGCQSLNPKQQNTVSSYVDYLEFEGKYYVNAWELALTDPAKVEKIGKVKKALRLEKGAPIYEITGYPDREIIAVKEEGTPTGMVSNMTGFSIYVWNEGNGQPLHTPRISESNVQRIQIFKGTKLIRELRQSDVQTFLGLMQKVGPHNEFQYDQTPQYTVLYFTDQALGYNYGILEKNGDFGLPHIESKLPAEIAHFFTDEESP